MEYPQIDCNLSFVLTTPVAVLPEALPFTLPGTGGSILEPVFCRLYQSGVPFGERQWASFGIPVFSQHAAFTMGILPVDERVVSLWV